MKKSLAFTLAEVLITLAIIGVVAAMTIPSVIVNTNQQQFKTGLAKAVSVLNSAITMNNALEGESPYDNADLFEYLQQHMSILKSTSYLEFRKCTSGASDKPAKGQGACNKAFYTTDGFRFEIPGGQLAGYNNYGGGSGAKITFNNSTKYKARNGGKDGEYATIGYCGSEGFVEGTSTQTSPCLILVDVNGDKKPNPKNSKLKETDAFQYPLPDDRLVKDVFPIIITDEKAIPYGKIAQQAMYQANSKK